MSLWLTFTDVTRNSFMDYDYPWLIGLVVIIYYIWSIHMFTLYNQCILRIQRLQIQILRNIMYYFHKVLTYDYLLKQPVCNLYAKNQTINCFSPDLQISSYYIIVLNTIINNILVVFHGTSYEHDCALIFVCTYYCTANTTMNYSISTIQSKYIFYIFMHIYNISHMYAHQSKKIIINIKKNKINFLQSMFIITSILYICNFNIIYFVLRNCLVLSYTLYVYIIIPQYNICQVFYSPYTLCYIRPLTIIMVIAPFCTNIVKVVCARYLSIHTHTIKTIDILLLMIYNNYCLTQSILILHRQDILIYCASIGDLIQYDSADTFVLVSHQSAPTSYYVINIIDIFGLSRLSILYLIEMLDLGVYLISFLIILEIICILYISHIHVHDSDTLCMQTTNITERINLNILALVLL